MEQICIITEPFMIAAKQRLPGKPGNILRKGRFKIIAEQNQIRYHHQGLHNDITCPTLHRMQKKKKEKRAQK